MLLKKPSYTEFWSSYSEPQSLLFFWEQQFYKQQCWDLFKVFFIYSVGAKALMQNFPVLSVQS